MLATCIHTKHMCSARQQSAVCTERSALSYRLFCRPREKTPEAMLLSHRVYMLCYACYIPASATCTIFHSHQNPPHLAWCALHVHGHEVPPGLPPGPHLTTVTQHHTVHATTRNLAVSREAVPQAQKHIAVVQKVHLYISCTLLATKCLRLGQLCCLRLYSPCARLLP